jgi:hypothetical protein
VTSLVGKPGDLMQNGLLVAVKLCAPKEVESTVPTIDTLAEIDTGVLITRIQEGVATSLGLEPAGTVKITTATTPAYKAYLYRIRLLFPSGDAFEADAIEVPYMVRPHVRIKCLIGRDILKYSILTYNGYSNTFSLNFSVKDMWTTGCP